MHDPLVVAFEIPRPWPTRSSFGGKKRWEWTVHGRGPWRFLRPGNWSRFVTVVGRRYFWPSLITIWHREPKGRDSGTTCKHWANGKPRNRWRWHVWHWKIQVVPAQVLRRFLLDRCGLCGRRFPWKYAPVSRQWDHKRAAWWRGDRSCYHHECSNLISLRRENAVAEALVRRLFAAVRVLTDEGEDELLARLTDPKGRSMEFHDAYRLTRLLGYERDEDYRLVKATSNHTSRPNGAHES